MSSQIILIYDVFERSDTANKPSTLYFVFDVPTASLRNEKLQTQTGSGNNFLSIAERNVISNL